MMRHGWQFVILTVSAITLTGCGNNKNHDSSGGATRWQSFPVAIYTDPSIVSNAQSQADFQDAMSFWEEKIGKKIWDYKGNWSGQAYDGGNSISENALYVASPWNYASNIAAQTTVLSQSSQIQGAVIMVNPNTSFCGGDCHGNNTSTSMRKVFAHELGHFIGLAHVQDTANIMYPDALPGGSLANEKVDAVALLPLVN
ncbi:MAG: matrixin family metalloprotease [Bdellovibrionota bacterium]